MIATFSDALYFIGATAAFAFGWYLSVWFGERHYREFKRASFEREARLKAQILGLMQQFDELAETKGIRRI